MFGEWEIKGRRISDVFLNISGIEYSCATWELSKVGKVGGLIAFSGEYNSGSSGTDDALHIRWRVRELIERVRPDGLVVVAAYCATY